MKQLLKIVETLVRNKEIHNNEFCEKFVYFSLLECLPNPKEKAKVQFYISVTSFGLIKSDL